MHLLISLNIQMVNPLKALNQTNHFVLRKEAKEEPYEMLPTKMHD